MNDSMDDNFSEEMTARAIRRLAAAGAASPSSDLTRRIMGAVAAEARREKAEARRRMARIAAVACGAAACLVAIFILPMTIGGRNARNAADVAADRLVELQEPDGSWSPSATGGSDAYRPALTALALMALDRHSPKRHEPAIRRAEEALLGMQSGDGAFGSSIRVALYNHSFATFALLGHAASNGAGLAEPVSRAIDFSLASQDNSGSWGGGDASLTLWQVAILLKARDAGWTDDGGHLRRGMAWLRREGRRGMFDYRGMIDDRYAPREGNAALTAMAAMRLREEAERHPELRETADGAIASLREAMASPRGYNGPHGTYDAAVALLANAE